MRIKKSNSTNTSTASVQASTAVTGATGNYAEAVGYIKSAISALSAQAKTDVLAKESIANLGVVLLDLNS